MREIDNYDDAEELSGPEASGRNWKGIGIALLVIAVICALVILAIVLIAPSHEEFYRDGVSISVFDVTDGSLIASGSKEVQWLSGHELLYQSNTNQSIIRHNLMNGTKSVFFDLKSTETFGSYQVSPTGRYLLFTQQNTKVYRHTQKALYKILDLTRLNQSLNDSWDLLPPKFTNPVKLQYARWAPGGEKDKLVFVYENDVYYKSAPDANVIPIQLTDTGSTDEKPEVVYNGIPDWLYEEEILSQDNAIWWSPDGQYLAFLSFNDTMVETFSFDTYGHDSVFQEYTNTTKIRYPKAGHRNPTVELHMVDLDNVGNYSGEYIVWRPTDDPEFKKTLDGSGDYYVTSVTWLSRDSLYVRWANRIQNAALLTKCSPLAKQPTPECETITLLKAEEGWLEDSEPVPYDNGLKFKMIMPHLKRDDGLMNNTICTFAVGSRLDPTCLKLNFTVVKILAVDPDKSDLIYATATFNHPRNRHLVEISGEKVNCLSCHWESNCTWYDDISFGPKSTDYFVWTCRGPSVPYSEIWKLDNLIDNGSRAEALDVLKSNAKLQASVNRKALPHRKYLQVPLSYSSNGPKAQVELLIPPRLSESAKKRYPLLIKVYGGPGSQEVHTRYRMEFEEMLASSNEVVIARIDGRGSGYQGHKFQSAIYKNLGTHEVRDQLEVARKLTEMLPYLDPARVGIWGWSYGGYAAARAVLLDTAPQVLKCAAAVAPVSDWRFYDTAYTERYMSTPQENKQVYETSNLMPPPFDMLYWHFVRTSFLLVHGTADDNVHFQQAAQFSKALMKNDVLFKTQVYPDEDHSIRKMRLHLYRTLQDHFLTCFGTDGSQEKGEE